MAFYGYHGVFAAEKEVGQKIEADLELHGDFEAAAGPMMSSWESIT